MANKYVRPDTSHSGTRDGTSFETAWGGWSEINWVGLAAGDTLYVCGTFLIASTISIGAHNGSTTQRVIVSGNYSGVPGVITITAGGGVFLSSSRANTEISNLTINANASNCIFIASSASNCVYKNNTFNAGSAGAALSFSGATGQDHQDVLIEGNTFNSLSTASATSFALNWFPTTGLNSSLTRFTIKDNKFNNFVSGRAIVHFRIQSDANVASKMTDIIINGNTWQNCFGTACEINSGFNTFGQSSGLQVINNKVYNQQPSPLSLVLGGGFSLWGFTTSSTTGFGANKISNNIVKKSYGPIGGFDLFFGSYSIYDNLIEDLESYTIDANGILFDYGCNNCYAYRNTINNLRGKENVENSGSGIMILDSTNIFVFGNVIKNVRKGLFVGNKTGQTTGQSATVYNNTFINTVTDGVYILSTSDISTLVVKNNIFISGNNSVRNLNTAWSDETYNTFYKYTTISGHTLSATSDTNSPYLLDTTPTANTPKGIFMNFNRDFTGIPNYAPPYRGALQYFRRS